MSESKPYSEMLLQGMREVLAHLSEWGRSEEVGTAVNLASGWVTGVVAEHLAIIEQDPERLALLDQMGPVVTAQLAAMREAEEQGRG